MKVEGDLMILLAGMEKLTSLEGPFLKEDLKPGDTNRLVHGACRCGVEQSDVLCLVQ